MSGHNLEFCFVSLYVPSEDSWWNASRNECSIWRTCGEAPNPIYILICTR